MLAHVQIVGWARRPTRYVYVYVSRGGNADIFIFILSYSRFFFWICRARRRVRSIVLRGNLSIMRVAARAVLGRLVALMRLAVVPARQIPSPVLVRIRARRVLMARHRIRYVFVLFHGVA